MGIVACSEKLLKRLHESEMKKGENEAGKKKKVLEKKRESIC